eukprot:2137828-Rhodomonas_salina.2
MHVTMHETTHVTKHKRRDHARDHTQSTLERVGHASGWRCCSEASARGRAACVADRRASQRSRIEEREFGKEGVEEKKRAVRAKRALFSTAVRGVARMEPHANCHLGRNMSSCSRNNILLCWLWLRGMPLPLSSLLWASHPKPPPVEAPKPPAAAPLEAPKPPNPPAAGAPKPGNCSL